MAKPSYPTPPPSPPKSTATSEADEIASLAQKLEVVGKACLLPLFVELQNASPKKPALQVAVQHLKQGKPSDIHAAIKKVAGLLRVKKRGYITVTRREIMFWRLCKGTERGGFGNLVARIYIYDHKHKTSDTPHLNLISGQRRQTFRPCSTRDLFDLFVSVLDCEVAFIAEQSATHGRLIPKTPRSVTLQNFRDNQAGDNPYIAEALYAHETGDHYGTVLNMVRGLGIPCISSDDIFGFWLRLDQTVDWNLRIAAAPTIRNIVVHIREERYEVVCEPTDEGRQAVADVFEEILRAYDTEVYCESIALSRTIEQYSQRNRSEPLLPSPESAQQRTRLKRKRSEDLRTNALQTSARKIEERPMKKRKVGSVSTVSSLGIGRRKLPPSRLRKGMTWSANGMVTFEASGKAAILPTKHKEEPASTSVTDGTHKLQPHTSPAPKDKPIWSNVGKAWMDMPSVPSSNNKAESESMNATLPTSTPPETLKALDGEPDAQANDAHGVTTTQKPESKHTYTSTIAKKLFSLFCPWWTKEEGAAHTQPSTPTGIDISDVLSPCSPAFKAEAPVTDNRAAKEIGRALRRIRTNRRDWIKRNIPMKVTKTRSASSRVK